MAEVFDVLRHDHNEVKAMLDELERGLSVTSGATGEQLEQRRRLVERLVIEESKHEAVEEEYFWPAVREHLQDGERLADQATGQEQEGKQVLDELRKKSPDDPEFESLVTQFISDGREHIEFEETQVWPGMQRVLTAEQAADLGKKIEQGKKIAPTRPHPKTPPKPGVLKTAGAGAAMVDRARDALSNRGED